MEDLLQQLQQKAGLTAEQAAKTIEILKGYVRGKVPGFLTGTVEKWFSQMEKKAEEKAAREKEDKEDDFLDT